MTQVQIDLGMTCYGGIVDVVRGILIKTWEYIASYNGESLPGRWLSDRDEYAPGTTPTTGAEVAYELATPIEVTLTPTQIRSFSGYNHIESSTGEMEIEYITGTYQPLVDLIDEAADTKRAYSTTEHVVGKWIDGKNVYEKTYSITPSSSPLDWTALETIGIDTFISYETQYVVSNGQVSGCDGEVRIAYNPPNEPGKLCYYHTNGNLVSFIATVRYTKTSSNNRSLSKGATDSLRADLSEEKKEIEESPETEEKTVKKAQSESEEMTEKVEEEEKKDETDGENKTVEEEVKSDSASEER